MVHSSCTAVVVQLVVRGNIFFSTKDIKVFTLKYILG